ncbi:MULTISPECIES: MFS transporter [unclassified Beijerinckia]|uniref:MFS transporter n=1 Tax=unclassified Beijerinckia TaxID=2638183 RepID=UPI000894A12B|nr:MULTISPECIES: MFS transporter [unclassified Beijerinckia]MDH7794014.1 AAHS family 4-hydroxybenzoate transporter-like MFS transporter [Beijerinckia sp. GAS462]SEB51397.1 MFS transporter, AAHS family, 4-hydroxybenzoate transporter [Beijerinckia sp. 28-YEA-48]
MINQQTGVSQPDGQSIDVANVIDTAPIGNLQLRTIALCGAIALLDGYDTLVIGFAAPALADHLNISRSALGPVFAIGLLGAAIGGLMLGALADRFGRKPMLIASALIFAFFCGLTIWVTNLPQLLACRFLAGIGLGGAAPCFIALASEFAPKRFRAAAITMLWACLPLGGILGGIVSTVALPRYGWETLFVFGAVAPLLAAAAAAVWLPESPRFLERTEQGRAKLARLLEQLAKRPMPDGTRLIVAHADQASSSIRALFSEGRFRMTMLLWLAFFFAAVLTVLIPLWSPTLLRDAGYSIAQSSLMVALFNIGAIVGMAGLGMLIDLYGARRVLTGILVLCAVSTAPIGFLVTEMLFAGALFTISGIGAGGGVAGIVALSAMLYPPRLRSTGVGGAAAAGRIGQMLGPMASGTFIALGWGIGGIFAIIAAPPLLAAMFVSALSRRENSELSKASDVASVSKSRFPTRGRGKVFDQG